VAEKRAHWHEQLAGECPARLVFVDESGANTKMTRWRGRSPIGQRLVARVPHGRYQTSTLISAVRLNGPCAPWLFEGAMDGEMFLAWVSQGLVPALQKNDLVIMDNLATHTVQGIREAIETAGEHQQLSDGGRKNVAPAGAMLRGATRGAGADGMNTAETASADA
jgi:hypothetical protein